MWKTTAQFWMIHEFVPFRAGKPSLFAGFCSNAIEEPFWVFSNNLLMKCEPFFSEKNISIILRTFCAVKRFHGA